MVKRKLLSVLPSIIIFNSFLHYNFISLLLICCTFHRLNKGMKPKTIPTKTKKVILLIANGLSKAKSKLQCYHTIFSIHSIHSFIHLSHISCLHCVSYEAYEAENKSIEKCVLVFWSKWFFSLGKILSSWMFNEKHFGVKFVVFILFTICYRSSHQQLIIMPG